MESHKEIKTLYSELIDSCPRFELKGKNMLYTSANGHMFSLLNKDRELGIRFSKERQMHYIQELDSEIFTSHGAKMKGYVKIPHSMWDNMDRLCQLMNESYDYVMSLKSK